MLSLQNVCRWSSLQLDMHEWVPPPPVPMVFKMHLGNSSSYVLSSSIAEAQHLEEIIHTPFICNLLAQIGSMTPKLTHRRPVKPPWTAATICVNQNSITSTPAKQIWRNSLYFIMGLGFLIKIFLGLYLMDGRKKRSKSPNPSGDTCKSQKTSLRASVLKVATKCNRWAFCGHLRSMWQHYLSSQCQPHL